MNGFSNLRISQNQLASKFGAERHSTDDHRMVTGRRHHHVSVQELRIQQVGKLFGL